jgi:hypothetical protein
MCLLTSFSKSLDATRTIGELAFDRGTEEAKASADRLAKRASIRP